MAITLSGLSTGWSDITATLTEGGVTKTSTVRLTVQSIAQPGTIVTNGNWRYPSNQNLGKVGVSFEENPTIYYAVGTQLTASNYSTAGSTEMPTATGKVAGNYTVYWYATATANYKATSNSFVVTGSVGIQPANVTAKNANYGSSTALVTVSTEAAEADIYYSVGTALNSTNYSSGSTTIPTAAGKPAGQYTIYWYVPAVANKYSEKVGTARTSTILKVNQPGTIISNGNWTYPSSAALAKTGTPFVENPTIYYAVGNTELTASNYQSDGSTTIPTAEGLDAGTYTVYWYAPQTTNYNEKKNYFTVTGSVGTQTAEVAAQNANYNTSAPLATVTSNPVGGALIYYAVNTALNSTNYSSGSTTIPTAEGKPAGQYTIYWYVPAIANKYKEKVGTALTSTISKVNQPGTIISNGNWTYPSSAALAKTGTPFVENPTIYYAVGNTELTASNYVAAGSTTIPTAEDLDAGTYTVYWYAPQTTNYNEKKNHFTVTGSVGTQTAEVAAQNANYNTDIALATVTSNPVGGALIYYAVNTALNSTNYSSGSTTIPTAEGKPAGQYTIYWYVPAIANKYSEKSGNVVSNVGTVQAELPATWLGDSQPYHVENSETLSVARLTVSDPVGGTLQYSTSADGISGWSSWSTTQPTRSGSVGSTHVKCKVVGDSNHTDSGESSVVTLTIRPNSDARATVNVPTTSLTYNRSAQNLTNGVTPHGCTAYVGLGTGSEAGQGPSSWFGANANATATNAGTYYIWYKFTPDANHNNSNTGTYVGSRTINRKSIAASSITVTLSSSSFTYSGSAQGPTVTVKDGSATLTSGTDYTVSGASKTAASTYTITVTGKGNYTGTNTSAQFTINRANQPGTIVKDHDFTYPSDVNLVKVGEAFLDSPTIYYAVNTALNSTNYSSLGSTTAPTATGKTAGNYRVYWYAPVTANYGEKSDYVDITGSIGLQPATVVAQNANYNTSMELVRVTANASEANIYYSVDTALNSTNYSSGSTTKPTAYGKNAGTYTIYWYVPAVAGKYPEKTDHFTSTISRIAGGINYTASNGSVVCTSAAATMRSTDGAKTTGSISSGATNNTGEVEYTISVSGWSGSAWTTNGRTVTVPTGTSEGSYSVTITAISKQSTNYERAEKSVTITVTVVPVTLESISLTLTPNPIDYQGTSTPTVRATYTNGQTTAVTNMIGSGTASDGQVLLSSSNTSVATIITNN